MMPPTDYFKARLELTVSSSSLKDLDRLEEGHYRLDRMDNTVRNTIRASEELLDKLVRTNVGTNELRRLRHSADRDRYYYMPSEVRGTRHYTDHKVYPGHRRAYSITESIKDHPQLSDKNRRYPSNTREYGLVGRLEGGPHARGSIEARLQKIRLQNNMLKAGLTRSNDVLFDEHRPGCILTGGAGSTRRTSGGDEMCSRKGFQKSNQCCDHKCEDRGSQAGLKESNIVIENDNSIEKSRENDDIQSQSHMGDQHISNYDKHKEPNGTSKKVTPKKPAETNEHGKHRNQLTLKKVPNREDQSLFEIVQEQNKLISKLTKQLGNHSHDKSTSNLDHNESSRPGKRKTPYGFTCESSSGYDISKGYDDQQAYSPVFGKSRRRLSDVSFENSKGLPKVEPNGQNIIHFQDGISRIQHKETSLGSYKDIELKIQNIDKLQEDETDTEKKTIDQNGGSTACTAPDRIKEFMQSVRDRVELKPYSSRDRFARAREDSSKHKKKQSSEQKKKTKKEAIKDESFGIKNKNETKKIQKISKSSRPVSAQKKRSVSNTKKAIQKVHPEKSVGKKIKPKQVVISNKKKCLRPKNSSKPEEGIIRQPLTNKTLQLNHTTLKRQHSNLDSSSVDRMFSSGALYQPEMMNSNGFDTFNNGLLAYCFIKRKIAPEYKKRVDQVVDRMEEFMVQRRLARLAGRNKPNL